MYSVSRCHTDQAEAPQTWRQHSKFPSQDDWVFASRASRGQKQYWVSPSCESSSVLQRQRLGSRSTSDGTPFVIANVRWLKELERDLLKVAINRDGVWHLKNGISEKMPAHGTRTRYSRYGCSCSECRAAYSRCRHDKFERTGTRARLLGLVRPSKLPRVFRSRRSPCCGLRVLRSMEEKASRKENREASRLSLPMMFLMVGQLALHDIGGDGLGCPL
jgi:hypothetical protein